MSPEKLNYHKCQLDSVKWFKVKCNLQYLGTLVNCCQAVSLVAKYLLCKEACQQGAQRRIKISARRLLVTCNSGTVSFFLLPAVVVTIC